MSKMTKAVFVIKTDGTVTVTQIASTPKLDVLQAAVGGSIETVPHFTRFEHEGKTYTRGTAYCNEEGLLHNLPLNQAATKAWLACLGDGPFSYKPELRGDVIFYATAK